MITKTYPLSLSRNYVSSWGLAEAVRELIQNALDSGRPFVYEFSPYDDDHENLQAMSLHSAGVTLNPSTLLLGSTDKTAVSDAIGQFGEGFKLALLVLTRLGNDVVIRNGPVDWTPWFERSELFQEETLVVKETDGGRPGNVDLSFEVYGLSQEDVDAITASCLLMQATSGEARGTRYGEILVDRPGALYVGNLYVCTTGMRYGYNVKPSFLKLDRDRQTVNSYNLNDTILKMWYETEDFDLIAAMIDEEAQDVSYARYCGEMPEGVKEACFRLFESRNPGALVAGSQSELDRLNKVGGRAVRVNSNMYDAVSRYSGYSGRLHLVKQKTPQERLTEFRDTYAEEIDASAMVALNAMIDEAEHWSIE